MGDRLAVDVSRASDDARRALAALGVSPAESLPPAASAFQLTALPARFDDFISATAALQHELARSYQHLSAVFEITERFSTEQDPQRIETDLLARYGVMLEADAVYVVSGRRCTLTYGESRGDLPIETIRSLSKTPAGAVSRETSEELTRTLARTFAGAHVLLGRLVAGEDDAKLVIALRDAGRTAFDATDRLASETVLVYGGQILRNLAMVRRLELSALQTVSALANAIDARDRYTHGHSRRVGWLARRVGAEIGLTESRLQELEWAGLLHDIGKIGVSESVLNKPGKLTDDEFEHVKSHTRLGYEVLRPVSSLEAIAEAALFHHENYDGSGYPTGLRGAEIPLVARILRVVDTFDALTSTRAYRSGLSIEAALKVVARGAGGATEPQLTWVFVGLLRRMLRERPPDFVREFGHLLEASGAA
ncbi:MAG: HD-GYP domain-containing protein [Planctomycetota bacterium]|nr:MAG: HD-GYP domain-containing protein [Planctomycetota bacterium]